MSEEVLIPSLDTQQLVESSDGKEPAYGTARNRTAQVQATLVVKLPVKDNAQDAEQMLASKAVAEEVVRVYYTRLLEDAVGVCPAGPALDLAMASLGLTASNVRAHTKVVAGALQVAGCAPSPPQPQGLPAEQVELLQTLKPLLTQIAEQQPLCSDTTAHSQGNSFDRLLHRYTYPFSCRPCIAKSCPPAQAAAAAVAHKTAHPQPGSHISSNASQDQTAAAAAKAPCECGCTPLSNRTAGSSSCIVSGHHECEQHCSPELQLTPDLWQELSQEFVVTSKTVAAAQQRFADSMVTCLNKHHSRDLHSWQISSSELDAVILLLQTPPMIKLAITMIYYLYTKYFLEQSSFPTQLIQHLRTQALLGGKAKAPQPKRRSTLLLPGSAGAAALVMNDELDLPEKWDVGIELLLQGKGQEAAERAQQEAAAAAAATRQMMERSVLLPSSIAARQLQQQQQHGAADAKSSNSSTPVSPDASVRPSAAGSQQFSRQESSMSSSSRSRSSFAGSVSSYQQQLEAAQHQAQLLASSSVAELQACRMSGMLWQWEELRQLLTRSSHGTTFALPITLLSLAGLMEEVFGTHFPAWGRSSKGAHTLQAMAEAPGQLLDPQGCYRSVAVLAGSPAAVAARQRHDAGPRAAADNRQRRLGLSSVVAAALAEDPGSPELRKMLHAAAAGTNSVDAAALQLGSAVAWSTKMGAAAVHTAAAHRMKQHVKRR